MENTINPDRVALTVNEFIASIPLSRTKFYDEVRRGRIKILKIGRITRVAIAQRAAFLQLLAAEQEAGQ